MEEEKSGRKWWKPNIPYKNIGLILLSAYIGISIVNKDLRFWDYKKSYDSHRQVDSNYDKLFEGCEDKNDTIDRMQELGMIEYIKPKEPPLHEKIRALSQHQYHKSIEDTLSD